MGRSRSAPTSAVRCACRRFIAASMRTSRPSPGALARPYAAAVPGAAVDRDLAVIGPMARSAADLSLLLDVIAGPDPLEAGVGYRLALPPSRHGALKDFRVLVIDTDPLLPTGQAFAARSRNSPAISAKAGVSVARQSPLLPDFADPRGSTCGMLMSFLGAFFPPEVDRGRAGRRGAAGGRRQEPRRRAAARHGAKPSRLAAGRRRARPPARAMARAVQDVRCGDLPDHADAGLSARPFAGAGDRAASRSTARTMSIPINWRGPASLHCPDCRRPRFRSACRRTGLPVGVQIVGPWLEDRTPLRLAELIEREFGGFVPPPMFDD